MRLHYNNRVAHTCGSRQNFNTLHITPTDGVILKKTTNLHVLANILAHHVVFGGRYTSGRNYWPPGTQIKRNLLFYPKSVKLMSSPSQDTFFFLLN